MKNLCLRAGGWIGHCLTVLGLMAMALVSMANGQAVSTTTVQGTVYLANGQPGAGTLDVSWPAFTTANNQAVTAGRVTVQIAPDGFMSVNLAPNLGAMPAGLYYTAVYHMSDGTKHGVLGGAGGGPNGAGAGAGASDACGAGNTGGEQGLRRPVDCADNHESGAINGWHDDRTFNLERRPDAVTASSGQALRGLVFWQGGSIGGREYDRATSTVTA